MSEPPVESFKRPIDETLAAGELEPTAESKRGVEPSASTLFARLEPNAARRAGVVGRVAALAGAGLLVGAALGKRSRAGLVAAATAALPLTYRGLTGRWPLPRAMAVTSVVVQTRLVVWRPRLEVYEAWRSFDRLPAILRHLERVVVVDERRSRWVAHAPGGAKVSWEAEITEDRPGEVLAWRSLPGSPVQQLGSLHFDPWRDGSTLLRCDLRLLPPAGAAGMAAAALLQPAVAREIHEDLRRFKHVVEAGELPTTAGQPHGERGWLDVRNPF